MVKQKRKRISFSSSHTDKVIELSLMTLVKRKLATGSASSVIVLGRGIVIDKVAHVSFMRVGLKNDGFKRRAMLTLGVTVVLHAGANTAQTVVYNRVLSLPHSF